MKAETTLFKIRYNAVGEERTEFLDTRDFGWEQVRRSVTFRHQTGVDIAWYQASSEEVHELISSEPQTPYYKVKWTRVPDLVERRKVILKAGMAYVPAAEQASIVYQEFQTLLEKALEVCMFCAGPTAHLSIVVGDSQSPPQVRRRHPASAHPRQSLKGLPGWRIVRMGKQDGWPRRADGRYDRRDGI